MSPQQHRIKRQVFEIRGCPSARAWGVQSEIPRIYYQRLIPLIETAFASVSTPDRILRIETLEIDLGEVPLDALEAALTKDFAAILASELAEAISKAQRVPGTTEDATLASHLELFTYYLKTGAVPWWADLGNRSLLEENLEFLIQQAPSALRQAVPELTSQDWALHRIVLSYPDHLLDGLFRVLAPHLEAALPGFCQELMALLRMASASRNQSLSTGKNLLWEETLRLASSREGSAFEPASFFRAILMRVAQRSGVAYRSLIADIDQGLKTDPPEVHPRTADIARSLYREIFSPTVESTSETDSIRAELVELLERIDRLGPEPLRPAVKSALSCGPSALSFAADLRVRLRDSLDRLPPRSLAEILAKLKVWENQATDGKTLTRDLVEELAEKVAEVTLEPAPIDLRFSDADDLYVNNSGLVILWPFLERFFKDLGLVDRKKFTDQAAVQRAVGVLQYLVSEDRSPREHLVALNKVLCGMALDQIFDFGLPVTEFEIEQCRHLLTAVIEHAPILRRMSIAGFRNTFLLRKGQLSARDGIWRLRVERETYDVVLDRFPWSVNWLKLPWMEFPMQVEW
jgi:Contractile injection system tape measure protein